MQPLVLLTQLLLMLSPSSLHSEKSQSHKIDTPDNAVSILIIFDNYKGDAGLETAWGFACLVNYQDQKLLFDTGSDADLYKKNVQLLGIHPEEIPSLFISHEHWDHTAGIPWVTETNPSIKCYLPADYAEKLENSGTLPPNSTGIYRPTHLYGPFYSTGDDFIRFREHGLVIKTADGGVLITGCGHPGVVEMVTVATEELKIPVHTVIGGLHLLQNSDEQVEAIAGRLKELGVKKICPTHCTGDNAISVLKQAFGDGYISGGTGTQITID